MASNRVQVSPSYKFTETDLTTTAAIENFGLTYLGIAGETVKGRAFDPIPISNYDEYKRKFGGLDFCKFTGTNQPIYEASYIAKEFLEESNQLYVTRILGLSGYDAGDAYSISICAGLDQTSVTTTGTESFTVVVDLLNDQVISATFSDSALQSLYDNGVIDTSIFGDSTSDTGDTISLSDTYYGDCDTYTGARFNATLIDKEILYTCITGTTVSTSGGTQTTTAQTCTVIYTGGTITNNSTFVITVVNPIVIINTNTNELITVESGVVQFNGGTIEHFTDGSLEMTGGSIFLPDGTIITGGVYKICDLNNNDAVYDCNTIDGTGYTIVSGTSTTTIPIFTTGLTTVITNLPSGSATLTYTGETTLLSGTPMDVDGTIVLTLRSFADYNGSELLTFQVKGNTVGISPLNGATKINPYDDFKIYGLKTDNTSFEYIVSFDQTKKNYIGRVFGGSFIKCCPSKTPFYIEENYQNLFDKWVTDGKIDAINTTICYNSKLNDFKTEYQGAVTPWVVSEVRGNRVFRLFRFHTYSHGNAANRDIKVSIENIRPDKHDFDVVVRRFDDTDSKPVVLERFSRVNLSTTSNNYIARAIGTLDGDYALNSDYIILEIEADCLDDSFPAGFEGYPVREYTGCMQPTVLYKTSYAATDRVRKTYLGISDTVGIEQDLFDFKGLPSNTSLVEWSGRTNGFHLDVEATGVTVEGVDLTVTFDTTSQEFKNEADLVGTDLEKLIARKFSLVPYGGFDGWDIHRQTRTNTDEYKVGGTNAQLGLTSGAFDPYVMADGTVGLTSDYYAYLKGILTYQNPEEVYINVITTPNVNTFDNSDLVEETIEMLEEDRCDAIYIVTTPDYNAALDALTPSDIANRLEGLYDTNYAATYVYWGQYYDPENNTYLYLPPTAAVVKSLALTDKVAAPWYAPAGIDRGQTNFIKTRYTTTLDDRDTLYDGRINPLFKDNGSIYIFGNKTLQEDDTALNRISIRRLLLHIRRLLADIAKPLLFEKNDQIIRNKFKSLIRPILTQIRTERGIFDLQIILDNSTEAFDSNELNGIIKIKPVRDVEFINIDFRLTDFGADFDEV
jgi:hypothetical protein